MITVKVPTQEQEIQQDTVALMLGSARQDLKLKSGLSAFFITGFTVEQRITQKEREL